MNFAEASRFKSLFAHRHHRRLAASIPGIYVRDRRKCRFWPTAPDLNSAPSGSGWDEMGDLFAGHGRQTRNVDRKRLQTKRFRLCLEPFWLWAGTWLERLRSQEVKAFVGGCLQQWTPEIILWIACAKIFWCPLLYPTIFIDRKYV